MFVHFLSMNLYLCFNSFQEKLKASELEVVHQKLNAFEEYLGDKQWLTGDKVSKL